MNQSIRRQMMSTLLASLGAVVLAGVGVLYLLVGQALLSQFDDGLQAKIRLLTLFAEVSKNGLELDFTEHYMPEFETADRGEYYQLWLRDGSALSKSPSLGEATLLARFGSTEKPLFWNLDLPNGRRGRAVGVRFVPTFEDGNVSILPEDDLRSSIILVFARDRTSLDRLLSRVRGVALAAGGILLVLTGLVVNHALNQGLRPIKQLTAGVEALEATSLTSARVETTGLPGELAPIAVALNSMIHRLHIAFEREKRLTADIAHQLNTPLSELLTTSEVALKWPNDPDATQNLARQTVDTVTGLQKVTHELLELARRQHATQSDLEEVDLVGLWNETRDRYGSAAETKHLRFDEDLPANSKVEGNRVLMNTILNNLLDNAIAYSPEGATIVCRLAKAPSNDWRFSLENPNLTLKETDLSHLFEPLWRHDASRTDSNHSGLGLALVKTIADGLGLDVRAVLPRPDVFCLILECSRVH